jgi:hypothetical protein
VNILKEDRLFAVVFLVPSSSLYLQLSHHLPYLSLSLSSP